jgi:hypothetical protein
MTDDNGISLMSLLEVLGILTFIHEIICSDCSIPVVLHPTSKTTYSADFILKLCEHRVFFLKRNVE